MTTPTQRTTVINNYHSDMYGFNSFFHPFGWGYGSGDFWFWMWIFDNNQFNQNTQIAQATNVNVNQPPANNFWADALLIAIVIGFVAAVWAITRRIRRGW